MTADTRQDVVADGIRHSVAVLEQLLEPERLDAIARAADVITASLRQGGLFAPISREGALILNNLFLATAVGAVLVGTLYPLVLDALAGTTISVGAPFFNLTFGALMAPLLLVLPFGPLLAWKRADVVAAAQRRSKQICHRCGSDHASHRPNRADRRTATSPASHSERRRCDEALASSVAVVDGPRRGLGPEAMRALGAPSLGADQMWRDPTSDRR